jgi:hypothetical protein
MKAYANIDRPLSSGQHTRPRVNAGTWISSPVAPFNDKSQRHPSSTLWVRFGAPYQRKLTGMPSFCLSGQTPTTPALIELAKR